MIRFHKINAHRFGHFMPNVEIYLCEKKFFKEKNKNKVIIDLHFFEKDPSGNFSICNSHAEIMVRRLLLILPYWLIYPLYETCLFFKIGNKHIVKNISSNKDPKGLLDKYDCHFSFNDFENQKGRMILSDFGLKEDSKFICLNVRDSSYLKEKFPNTDFSYHDYRDVDISIFKDAILELLKRNYFIFRVGKIANQTLNISHKNYIDLTNTNYDDFIDIYLGAKCDICITTSSGFDSTPYVFRRKIIFLQVPISHFFSSSKRYFIFTKYLQRNSDKNILKLKEIFQMKLQNADNQEKYITSEISLILPSSSEIKEIILEALDYFDIKEEINYSNEQVEFWNIYSKLILNDISLKNFHEVYRSHFSEIQIKKLL
ncbi:TIGR04372 family glycosyltransferase [Alphaproteobacteria bacterium]|nr:TIGR04372 family glycosyltransferase [Alphaproteobacteria bacterium]